MVSCWQNLLNWPCGNLNKVASILAEADVMSIAIVPAFLGEKDDLSYITNSNPIGLKTPFPLHVIALCLLR